MSSKGNLLTLLLSLGDHPEPISWYLVIIAKLVARFEPILIELAQGGVSLLAGCVTFIRIVMSRISLLESGIALDLSTDALLQLSDRKLQQLYLLYLSRCEGLPLL